MIKNIIPFLFFIFTTLCIGQQTVSEEDRKLINQHINYVNQCIDFINKEVTSDLSNYNFEIYKYINLKNEGKIEDDDAYLKYQSVKLIIDETSNMKKKSDREKLALELKKIRALRAKNNSPTSKALQKALQNYNTIYNELLRIAVDLAKTHRIESVVLQSSKNKFKKPFETFKTYEVKHREFVLANDQFEKRVQQLYGEEKLPEALEVLKDIIFASRGMIRSIQQKDKKKLQNFIKKYETNVKKQDTLAEADHEERKSFLNNRGSSIFEIKQSSKEVYEISLSYLYDKTISEKPTKTYRQGKQHNYEYEAIIVSGFHQAPYYYNFLIKDVKTPVLSILKELNSFKTYLPLNQSKKIKKERPKKKTVVNNKKLQNNLVVLIDLSTSANQIDNLDKLKKTIINLIDILPVEDQLTILSYTPDEVKKIVKTKGNYNKEEVKQLVSILTFKGKVNNNRISGVENAYKKCLDEFLDTGNNRIMIISDGDFEVDNSFMSLVQKQANKGIYLSTLHYTNENENRTNILADLARIGKGKYNLILKEDDVATSLENEILLLKQSKLIKENEILTLKKGQLIKENEISSLKQIQSDKETEIDHQRAVKRTILISFIIFLIPIFILLYVYFQKLKTQHQLTNKQEEINQQKVSYLLKNQELKLIKASLKGENKERTRIAQELHDSIGGNLSSIKLQLDNFNEGALNYDKIVNQIDETYEQVRDMSHNLIPKKFVQNPFTTLIEEYIENINNTGYHFITYNLYPEEELNNIDENLQVEIYNMMQELLTNTIKHAKADKITIQLNYIEDTIKLLFEDNGIGFIVSKNKLGVGLTNIKNRLKKYNGVLHIDAVPRRGTIVNIDIPVS